MTKPSNTPAEGIVRKLAEWSKKYPRSQVYGMSKMSMDDELMEIEKLAVAYSEQPSPEGIKSAEEMLTDIMHRRGERYTFEAASGGEVKTYSEKSVKVIARDYASRFLKVEDKVSSCQCDELRKQNEKLAARYEIIQKENDTYAEDVESAQKELIYARSVADGLQSLLEAKDKELKEAMEISKTMIDRFCGYELSDVGPDVFNFCKLIEDRYSALSKDQGKEENN